MGMFDRFRDRAERAPTPPLPDFEVIALDPGDWPGGVAAAVLARPDGSCRGVALRYDLVGGSAPVYALVHERPDDPRAPDAAPDADDGVPAAVALILAAAGLDDAPPVLAEEGDLATVGGEPIVITRLSYEDPQLSYVSFDRPDGTLVGIAGWCKPVNNELLALLRPLALGALGNERG